MPSLRSCCPSTLGRQQPTTRNIFRWVTTYTDCCVRGGRVKKRPFCPYRPIVARGVWTVNLHTPVVHTDQTNENMICTRGLNPYIRALLAHTAVARSNRIAPLSFHPLPRNRVYRCCILSITLFRVEATNHVRLRFFRVQEPEEPRARDSRQKYRLNNTAKHNTSMYIARKETSGETTNAAGFFVPATCSQSKSYIQPASGNCTDNFREETITHRGRPKQRENRGEGTGEAGEGYSGCHVRWELV